MLEKGRISGSQAAKLIFTTILSTVILFVPSITVKLASHDAWLATGAGSVLGYSLVFMLCYLEKMHPGKTIFQYAQATLGRFLGKLVGLLYVLFFIHMAATVIRQFGDFLTTAFMPFTPILVFNLSLIVLAVYAVYAGLENIARCNEFIILLIVSFLAGVILLTTANWDLNSLRPFLARGILPVLKASIVPAAWFGESVVLAALLPNVIKSDRVLLKVSIYLAALTGLMVIAVVGTLAVFGPEMVAAVRFSLHLFVRSINIGQVLTRFEVLVMVTWVAGVFIKTSVLLYCASLGLAQTLGLSEYRPVILPLGVIIGTMSIFLFDNVSELVIFLGELWPIYSILVFYLGLPLLMLCVTLAKRFLFDKENAKDEKAG